MTLGIDIWHSFAEFGTRLQELVDWHVREGTTFIFTKWDFWLFFLVVLGIMSFLQKYKLARSLFLSAVSLWFFYKTSGLYVLLLVISVSYNYFLGRRIYKSDNEVRRKLIIATSVIFNVLILAYFKYAYFFTESFNEMFQTNYELINHFAQFGNGIFGEGTFVEKILLPVGVSFFTFQNISYVVDIYRKEIKPVTNIFHYAFFVTFFPQLVMGPIVRARDFIPQITQPFHLSKIEFSWAVMQILKGLIKKIVIADFLVMFLINKVVFDFETFPGFISVIAMWAYSIHIYTDFSGYTDIAIGLSRLLGFKLKPNFNSPYKAINVADFWRRWHISLGSWLKDYLYIPLGGNRTGGIGSYIAIVCIFIFLIFITQWWELLWIYGGLTVVYLAGVALFKNFKKYVHRDLNLLITMVIGGLWHGPSENFVIWGAMNGSALIIFKYWSKISATIKKHSKYWFTIYPLVTFALYELLIKFVPAAEHDLVYIFFAIWGSWIVLGWLVRLLWRPFEFVARLRYNAWLFLAVFIGFVSYCVMFRYGVIAYDGTVFTWGLVLTAMIGLLSYLGWESKNGNMYEVAKTRFFKFWPMWITFNFITLTRIWFKLDEKRITAFNSNGWTQEVADAKPMEMIQHIWNRWDFDIEYFWRFFELFEVPIWIMLAGFAIHWLPGKFKQQYERWFTTVPMYLQVPIVVVIVVLLYQAIGPEQPPFVYLQF